MDPTRCPICGEPNVCAMEKAKETGSKPERCWCMDAVFTPAVMEQVPNAAMHKTMLLFNTLPMRNSNFSFTLPHRSQLGSDQMHGSLLTEAVLHAGRHRYI